MVSWSIDKLAIIDSFGKTLSVCRKGLSLESGKPAYLPLFSGECNVPSESDNSTSSNLERIVQDKQSGGIGPFTKEQNYEQKDSYSIETLSKERTTASLSSSKGVGPFTKDQNLRIIEGKENFKSNNFEDLGNRRSNNPWNIIDISSDGDSNSLENSDSEKGRGFSSSNLFTKTSSPQPSVEPSTEFLPEIREPVLQVDKKETGRSLKFPEITEPILRPRSARQNTRNEVHKQDEMQQETLSTSRGFTVQFLPERLAGILAQAERYARQTLLPLISQYTPSFVSGSRYEEPKYFPPLGEIATENYKGSGELTTNNGQQNFSIKHNQDNQTSGNNETGFKEEMKIKSDSDITQVIPAVVEVIYPEKDVNSSTAMESNEWVPIEPFTLSSPSTSRKDLNVSRSLNWERERYNWSTQTENNSLSSKMDDWVPITVKNEIQISSESSNNVSNEISSTHVVTDKQIEFSQMEAATIKEFRNNSEAVTKDERKYIPLSDPEVKELSSTSSNDISETNSSSTSSHSPYSHIQKIPRPKNTRNSKVGNLTRRTMVFPYAYEKNKDPRTRYIPLIPEEDLKRPHFPMERKR